MSKPLLHWIPLPYEAYARRASHIGHRDHLCERVGRETLEQYKDLVRNAQFVCKVCGRTAGKKEHLCDPDPL
jgi:hypothetical protein